MYSETDWDALIEWSKRLDDRSISDEARRWADTEARFAMIEHKGEWVASMEAAFEAGRQWERMKSSSEPR